MGISVLGGGSIGRTAACLARSKLRGTSGIGRDTDAIALVGAASHGAWRTVELLHDADGQIALGNMDGTAQLLGATDRPGAQQLPSQNS